MNSYSNSYSEADWESIILINPGLLDYFEFSEIYIIAQLTKRIRSKLLYQFFPTFTLTPKVLNQNPNYFGNPKVSRFNNFSYIEKFKIITKYHFKKEIAFRKVQIDNYVSNLNFTTENIGKVCKELTFHGLNRPSYYLLKIVNNFYNLRFLSLQWCDLNLNQFNQILKKLNKIEVLELIYVNLVITSTLNHDSSSNNLIFPQSLQELSLVSVTYVKSSLPEQSPLSFICNERRGYNKVDLDLFPQKLPNLKSLVFFNTNKNSEALGRFFGCNPQLEFFSDKYTKGLKF